MNAVSTEVTQNVQKTEIVGKLTVEKGGIDSSIDFKRKRIRFQI